MKFKETKQIELRNGMRSPEGLIKYANENGMLINPSRRFSRSFLWTWVMKPTIVTGSLLAFGAEGKELGKEIVYKPEGSDKRYVIATPEYAAEFKNAGILVEQGFNGDKPIIVPQKDGAGVFYEITDQSAIKLIAAIPGYGYHIGEGNSEYKELLEALTVEGCKERFDFIRPLKSVKPTGVERTSFVSLVLRDGVGIGGGGYENTNLLRCDGNFMFGWNQRDLVAFLEPKD